MPLTGGMQTVNTEHPSWELAAASSLTQVRSCCGSGQQTEESPQAFAIHAVISYSTPSLEANLHLWIQRITVPKNIVWSHFLQENIQGNNKENSVLLRGAQLHSKRRCFDISIPVHVDREYISVVQEGETRTRQMPMSNQRSLTSFRMSGRQVLETCSICSTFG